MNTNRILESDVLDIIFDNRNKLYGAYILRKFYHRRVKTALALMLASASLFCFFVLLPSGIRRIPPPDIETVIAQIAPDVKPKPQPETHPTSASNSNMRRFLSNISIKKIEDTTDVLESIEAMRIGSLNTMADGVDVPGLDEAGDATGNALKPNNEPVVIDPELPVEHPDEPPMFPGGLSAFRKFLERNLKAPEELEAGTQVSVKVKCVIGYDGMISKIEVIEDGGQACNEEVIRVLNKMPKWIPGKSNGRTVSAYHIIPVKFVQGD